MMKLALRIADTSAIGFATLSRPEPQDRTASPVARHPTTGAIEVADILNVDDRTAYKWSRRVLPEADRTSMEGCRTWERQTILTWAGRPSRIKDEASAEDYRRCFTFDPAAARRGGKLADAGAERPAEVG